ncbi:TPA: hypothetical protein HA219_02690 [Candidatus Woesearchaeota archaeon]|nr:hypothetical protein [Candidatus Woesearchaeota archaeon]HIH39600.1 hypothetical protein [Candidatus Woesearchaeota archaeon]
MSGGAAVSDKILEDKVTTNAGITADSVKTDISINILTEENLRISGVKASRMMFNNHVQELNTLAQSVMEGTQYQIDIRELPEYELVLRAVAALKKASMKEIAMNYHPETGLYYNPQNGQVNGCH